MLQILIIFRPTERNSTWRNSEIYKLYITLKCYLNTCRIVYISPGERSETWEKSIKDNKSNVIIFIDKKIVE